MASPIYFFPRTEHDQVVKGSKLDHGFLAAHGCAPAFDGIRDAKLETSAFALTGNGPGGASGLMIQSMRPGRAPVRIGFHPKFQTWHEKPAGADCWVGIDNEYPPTPGDLAKVDRPDGYEVELADGYVWRVPIVRSPFKREELGRSQMPRDFVFNGDGHVHAVRTSSSDRLWELSGVAWDHTVDRENHPSIDLDTLLELCIEALAVNYRFGRIEQQVMRTINSTNWEAITNAVLDVRLVDEMLALQKKRQESLEAGLQSHSPGAEG